MHHGSNRDYLDRNHGSILILWDRLFGTFEEEDEPVVYGLTSNIDTFNPVASRPTSGATSPPTSPRRTPGTTAGRSLRGRAGRTPAGGGRRRLTRDDRSTDLGCA